MRYIAATLIAALYVWALVQFGLGIRDAQAHNIVCDHTHVNAFRVHCDPDFALCQENNKPGCCVTQKTVGLINTWDCACVTSDAAEPEKPILLNFKDFDLELKPRHVEPVTPP
jgi:hypothetical protein